MNEMNLKKELNERFKNIRFHDDLFSDINDIIKKSGNTASFLKKLMTNLNLLNEFKDMAPLKKSNIFESLKGSSNLYSMRIKMQANIRILYSIDSNGTILLYGFYERGGKQKTNYKNAIPIAQERYKESIK